MCKLKGSVPGGRHRCSNHVRKDVERRTNALKSALYSEEPERGPIKDLTIRVQEGLKEYAATPEGTLVVEQLRYTGAQGMPKEYSSGAQRLLFDPPAEDPEISRLLNGLLAASTTARIAKGHAKEREKVLNDLAATRTSLVERATSSGLSAEERVQVAQAMRDHEEVASQVRAYLDHADQQVALDGYYTHPDQVGAWPARMRQTLTNPEALRIAREHARKVRERAVAGSDHKARYELHERHLKMTETANPYERQKILDALDPATRKAQQQYWRGMRTYATALGVMSRAVPMIASDEEPEREEYVQPEKKQRSLGARIKRTLLG